MIPPLHRHDNQFAERNLFLHALLGLVSSARRTEAFILAVASPASPEAAPRAPRAQQGPSQGDARVYLLLGVVSLWRRIDRELQGWLTEVAAAPSECRDDSVAPVPVRGAWFR